MENRAIEPVKAEFVNKQQPWSNEEIDTIKRTVAKGATNEELKMFLHLAATYGLDPFAKDIWFIKDRAGNPIIMTSRDGYLKIANRDENYDGMDADVVYQGDKFNKLKDGVEHVYETKNRGNPVGAYAMIYRKDRTRPVYVYAPFSDYFRNSPVWKQYPHAMILKVAEAQALKRAFSISGLVTREEMEENTETVQTVTVKAVQAETQAETQASEAPNGRDLGEYKKKLYLAYLKLCGNSSNAAQHEMMKITQGRGSAQWTSEDLRALVQDIEAKRKIIQQETAQVAD